MSRRTLWLLGAVVLAASALLARVHPFGDAGLYADTSAQPPLMPHTVIPADVRDLLTNKCADCHSMQRRMPWYDQIAGRFAPASWLLERDIVDGRKRMNLSHWESYSADQQDTFKAKMVEQTKNHKMPLLQYRIIHWGSNVNPADVAALSKWSHEEPPPDPAPAPVANAKTTIAPAPVVPAVGDPIRGEAVFAKRCTGCHSMTKDHEGPRLAGIFGKPSASVEGFEYSAAMKKANVVWDEATLDRWLANPDSIAPGNDMDFRVPKPQERKDLIALFKQGAAK